MTKTKVTHNWDKHNDAWHVSQLACAAQANISHARHLLMGLNGSAAAACLACSEAVVRRGYTDAQLHYKAQSTSLLIEKQCVKKELGQLIFI